MPLPAWSIYKLAAKRHWLGIFEAPNAKAAIEAAAREFKTDARRLFVVWQRWPVVRTQPILELCLPRLFDAIELRNLAIQSTGQGTLRCCVPLVNIDDT
jgi:hypothetical protein